MRKETWEIQQKCIPNRNFGIKVAILYLLVETKLEQKSAFAALLLSAITLSPVKTCSFCHGHFHFRDLNRDIADDFGFLGVEWLDGPGKVWPLAG